MFTRSTSTRKILQITNLWLTILALLGTRLFVGQPAMAQSTYTWTGGGADGNWASSGNWVTNVGSPSSALPQGYLNFTNTTRVNNTNNFAAGSAGFQIYFKAGSASGPFNLYGNPIKFVDFSSVDPNIQNEGTVNTQTINFGITNGNTHGVNGILNVNLNSSTAQGPLVFNGIITAADTVVAVRALNVSGSNTVTFNGVISDFSSSGKMALSQLGTGTTILTAANTYSGATTISAGRLVISNGVSAPTTYNIASGATVELTALTVNPLSAATIFTNNGTLKFDGGSSGVIVFSAAGNNVVQLSAGGLLQVSSNTTITASSGYHGIWNNNLGSLTVDSGSTINFVETGGSTAGTVAQFDALNGGGTISMGYLTYRTLSVGNANGSGAFSGVLKDAGSPALLAFLKNGTGTQILSGSSTYTGGTTISNGVLEADSNTALGTGAVTMSGGTLSNNVSDTLANAVIVSSAATIGVGSGKTLTLGGVISSSGPLTKTGVGTLILTGANTYSGQTTNSVGELDFLTSSASGSAVNITASSGATNGIIVTSNGGQWVNTGSVTNQNSSAFHVVYNNSYGSFSPSTTVAPMSVANLSLGTSLTMRIDGSSSVFNVGQSYPLITWTSAGPANATGFTTLVLPTGVIGNLSVTGSTLYLNVTGNTSQLTWNTASGNWDTATANWTTNSGVNVTKYVDGTSGVLFGDGNASGNPIITLAASYSPQGVLMKSTSHNYFIASGNAIAGSTSLILDPANTQTLTLSNANTFTGGTTIGGGTLAIGGAGSLGSGSYAGAIVNNGNLNLGSSASQTLSGIISGTGALNYQGSGGLTLNGANTYSGGTTISNNAIVYPQISGSASPLGTGPVTVNSGCQIFDTFGPGFSAVTTTNAVTLNGGTLHIGGGGNKQWNLNGPITTTVTTATTNNVTVDGGTGYSGGNYSAAIFISGSLNMGSTTNTLSCSGGNYGINIGGSISGANGTIIDTTANLYLGNANNPFSGTIRSGGSTAQVQFNTASSVNYMTVDMNAADSGSFTFANPVTIGGLMGSRNLSVGGSAVSIGTNNTSTTYSGSLGGTGNITKLGTGTLNLFGTNNFTGELIFNNGIVNVSNLATYASEAANGSPLGGRTAAQDTSSTVGLHFTGGTLQYTNTGLGAQTTDHNIRVLGGYAGIACTIDASGATAADTITFSQSGAPINFWDAAGVRSVQLTGSNTGINTFALNIPDFNNGSSKTSLIKSGAGVWDVTNPHNSDAGTTTAGQYGGYTGGTALYGGTLGFVNGALGSSGTIVFSNNATLGWDTNNSQDLSSRLKISDGVTATIDPGTNNVTFASALSVGSTGSGALTKLSSGTLTMSGVNTFSGATTISAGTLAIGGAGSLGSGSYAGNITNNATLTFNSSAVQTLTGIISGTGSINALGSGNFRMDGANTYSGGTTIGNCTVNVWKNPANNTLFGTGPVTMNSALLFGAFGNFTITNSLTLNGASLHTGGGSGSLSFSGPITLGTNGVFIGGDGGTAPISLSGNVSFGTNTIISSYGSGESYIGTLNGSITGSGGVLLTTNTGFANLTFNGAVIGPISLYHNGINNGTLVLGTANTFNGTARSQSGTLYVNNALGLQNATLDMNAADSGAVTLAITSPTLGALMGVRNLSLPSGTTAIGNNNSNTVYGGALSGSAAVAKIGSGMLTLSGSNGYSGATIISAGTLALGTNQVLPLATIANLNGGILAMGTFSNTVSGIQIAGVAKSKGTWGASGSGATHISASITGTGILTVTNGGSSTSVVTSSANPSTYGSSVIFTNTVTGSGGDGSAPSGTVTFYDGTNSIGTGTLVSSAGTVSIYTITNNSLAAATHSITASYAGNASYDVSTSSALSQVVNQATSTAAVAVNNSPVTYDGHAHAATVTLSGTNTTGTVTTILTGGASTQTAQGTYAVTATFVPANTNYTTLTGLSAGNFTINLANLTITASAQSKTYGTALTLATTAFISSGLTNGDSIGGVTLTASGSLPGNTVAATVGNYTITPSAVTGSGLSNYSITYNTGILTVSQLAVGLSGTRGYDGTTNAAAANLSVTNAVNSDIVTVATGSGGLASANVGTSAITSFGSLALSGGAGTNYTLAGASGSMMITNTLLNITANSDSKTYDGNAYATNNGVTYTGFVNGETSGVLGGTLTYGGTSQAAINAGSYVIIPSGLTSTNYAITFNNGMLTINQAASVVTAVPSASGITFGQMLSASTLSGGSATPAAGSFAYTAPSTTPNAGTASQGVTFTPDDTTNYTTISIMVNLTVNPAALGVAANNDNKTYNGLGYTGGNGVVYYGFVNGDTAGSLGGSLSYGGTSQNATNAGTYTIVPSGLASANYAISYTNGTLTVNPTGPSIGASSSENPSGYKDGVTFGATLPADATGNVIFSAPGGAISTNTISSGSATSLSITNLLRGTNQISFIYLGDGNYLGSTNTLSQVVTNHPPAANNINYSRSSALNSFKVLVSDLLTNVTDVDGDTFTLASVGTTTNNATVLVSAGYVMYYNTNAVADQFSYIVSDGFGGTNSATVTVNVDSAPLFGQSQIGSVSSGTAILNFAGIPGLSYTVARSTDLTTWLAIWTTNAPAGGLFQFIDTSAPSPNAYYRLQYNP